MRPPSDSSALELNDVCCTRDGGEILRKISATFGPGGLHLVTGSSAQERALLFRLLSLSERPDSGDVLLDGKSTRELDDAERAELRARRLGLVFAAPFLLPSFSAIENIAMPLFKQAHLEPEAARSRAETALEFVGLSGCEEIAGGDLNRFEQYCVSLARAIASEPGVLLVEELDSIFSGDALRQFTALLRQAAGRFQLTAIATAASSFAAPGAGRKLSLENGMIEFDSLLLREPFA